MEPSGCGPGQSAVELVEAESLSGANKLAATVMTERKIKADFTFLLYKDFKDAVYQATVQFTRIF